MLKSTYSSIDVDLTLLNPRHPTGKSTSLKLDSTHGFVNLKLVSLNSLQFTITKLTWDHSTIQRTTVTNDISRAPFNATITATYGSSTIWLPEDFQGLVCVYTVYGSVKISKKFLESVTLRHEADHTQRLFVGDLTALGEQDRNVRDEVYVSAEHGTVRIRFLDEDGDREKKGFFGRMFNRS